ncbi:MAG: tetratricopeptide repeat protein, partial [Planctomycetota bacterium]
MAENGDIHMWKKSIGYLGVIACLVLGCSQSNTPSGSDNNQQEPATASNQTITPTAGPAKVGQSAQDLESLTRLAKQYESTQEFTKAATIWGQVEQLVAEQFGNKSWQAQNATMAYRKAIDKGQLTPDELQQLKVTVSHAEELQKLISNQELQSALDVCKQQSAIFSRVLGHDSIEVGQCSIQSATIQHQLGQLDNATKNYHHGIETLKSQGMLDHPELEIAHTGLAEIYASRMKLRPAISNQKEAARIAAVAWGDKSRKFASQANQLGVLYHRAGNLEVAFELLEHTKNLRESQFGNQHEAFA